MAPGIRAGDEKPERLLVVRPTLGQGGADRVTLTLLQHLDRRRYQPTLVLMRAEGALLSQVPEDVPVLELGASSLWTAWLPLARVLRRLAPQVLLSTSSGANLIACLAHLVAGRNARLVLSERNVLHRGRRSVKRQLQLLLKRWLYPRADCVTAVSLGVAEDLATTLHLPAASIQVVYNPAVTDDLTELAQAAVPHPWFADDEPVVLGVGRLVPAKGFDDLMRVFARLDTTPLAPRLVLLGEGPERHALEALAIDLGIAERVWFAGFDSNPFRYMSRCAVFVLSSRHEGLPGALIQAMGCGAAVVSTDCPAGPAEIIDHGVDGFLVPVGDLAAMVARLGRLLEDGDLRAEFGRAARLSAQRFSLNAILDNYLDALSGNSDSQRYPS